MMHVGKKWDGADSQKKVCVFGVSIPAIRMHVRARTCAMH